MSKIIADCTRDNNYSVAIVDKNGNLDAFSFENQQKKTIKSNIVKNQNGTPTFILVLTQKIFN